MKALWLGFSLLFLLSGSVSFARQSAMKLSAEQMKILKEELANRGKALAGESAKDNIPFSEGTTDLLGTADELYAYGYLSLDQLNSFSKELSKRSQEELCKKSEPGKCGQRLAEIFEKLHKEKVKFKEPKCLAAGELASAGICCSPLAKLPAEEFKAQKSCKAESASCSSHGDCCSKLCNKENPSDKAGSCAPAMKCFEVAKKGQECGSKNARCIGDLFCAEVDFASSGIGGCLENTSQCSSNSDCCSDKCESGKCVEKRVCMACAVNGQKAGSKQECCPGLIKNESGVCVEDFPPLGSAMPETSMIDSFSKKAGKKIGQGIEAVFSLIFPKAAATTCELDSSGMTVGADGQAAQYKSCMDEAVKTENAEMRDRKVKRCEAMKEVFIKENKETGCKRRILKTFEEEGSKQEYRKMYNGAVLANVTKSNVDKCEFNSFKDAWIAKSDLARNAELAMMAFEIVHSGKGHDMILSGPELEPGKSQYWGRGIFERAQRIALKLRENRAKLVQKFLDIDKEMTCKCLATFGAEKLGKAELFGAQCGGVSDYVTKDKVQGAPQGGEGSDGIGMEDQSKMAESGEGEASEKTRIDKGAVGISNEKLLVEWLALRKDAQIVNFTDNSRLEQELMDLSEFIKNYPWAETPTSKRNKYELYSYKRWWRSGFARFVRGMGGLTLGLTGSPTLSALFGDTDREKYKGAGMRFDSVTNIQKMYEKKQITKTTRDSLFGLFNGNPENEPNIEEPQTRGTHCIKRRLGVCLRRANTYRRDLYWPYFDNSKISSPKMAKNRCRIHGNSTSCIKSVYNVDHNFEYSQGLGPLKDHPLLDVPLPISVGEVYKVEEVRNGKTYADLLSEAFEKRGLPAAKNSQGRTVGSKVKKASYHESFKYKVFNHAPDLKQFAIDQGRWKPLKFNDYKSEFLKGVKDYAMCRDLKEDGCVKHSPELVKNRESAVGLGHLFEKEEDAEDFAKYVYEMHVVYPKMSAGGRIGYPTRGLNAYYQTMAYNLRLMGSLALERAGKVNDLYNLYLSDLEKRKSDYQGLGAADEGIQSRNVEVGQRVWDEIETLDFSNSGTIEAFSSNVSDFEESGAFAGADLEVAQAVASHALRNLKEKKKKEEYEKKYGASDRGKRRRSAADSLAAALGRPLDRMSMTVGGQTFGAGTSSSLASSKQSNQEKEKNGKNGINNGGNPFEWPATTATYKASRTTTYGQSGYGSGANEEGASLNIGLSDSEARAILNAAERDSSLEEVLPGDSLWNVVSKAYKRNLSRVLLLRDDIRDREGPGPAAKEEIKDSEKAKLQKLLESQAN